jgi:hypothetical protein
MEMEPRQDSKNDDGSYWFAIPILGKDYLVINHISAKTMKDYLEKDAIQVDNTSRMISKEKGPSKEVMVIGVDIIFQDMKSYKMKLEKLIPAGISKDELWTKYGITLMDETFDLNIPVSKLPK